MVRKDWWGRSASIDLHGCDPELLKDPKTIKIFVKDPDFLPIAQELVNKFKHI